MAKILVIEDDELLGSSLRSQLQQAGHEVELVVDGKEGLDRLNLYKYDVAILDWNLPGLNGDEVLRQYRGQRGVCPVIMLTSNSDVDHKIAGLDSGADDYVTKPFEIKELHARIRSVLRRPADVVATKLKLGELSIDIGRRAVSRDGINIRLLPREFALLEFLVRHADEFFDVDALLNHVWNSESDTSETAVWQTVKRLRAKLDKPDEPSVIVNVKGLGYKVDKSRLVADDFETLA